MRTRAGSHALSRTLSVCNAGIGLALSQPARRAGAERAVLEADRFAGLLHGWRREVIDAEVVPAAYAVERLKHGAMHRC